jgi:hypothetical protein
MRKTRLTVLAAIMIAAWTSGCGSPAPEKVELRIRLQKGQSFIQKMQMKQRMTQTVDKSTTVDFTLQANYDLHTRVVDVKPDGTTTLKTTHQNAYSKVSGDLPADSPDVKFAHALLKAYEGQSLLYTINKFGRIVRIEGVASLAKRAADTLPHPAPFRKKFAAKIQKNIEEVVKQNASVATLPEKPVAIGDSWSFTPDVKFSGPIKSTLVSRENGVATLASQADLYSYPILPPLEMPEAHNILFDVSGMDKTQVRMDEATGSVIELEIDQHLSGKITLKSKIPPKAGSTTSWPVDMKMTVKTTTISPPSSSK